MSMIEQKVKIEVGLFDDYRSQLMAQFSTLGTIFPQHLDSHRLFKLGLSILNIIDDIAELISSTETDVIQVK